jgi:hypothetical protein
VSDASAAEIYRARTQLLDEEAPVTPRIRAYAEALLARWPDGDDESPWSVSPLLTVALQHGGGSLGIRREDR